jgi:hypothetical protein
MPRRTTRHKVEPIPTPVPTDKKAHTAGLGIFLILLTNYQAEVKQLFSFLLKSIS